MNASAVEWREFLWVKAVGLRPEMWEAYDRWGEAMRAMLYADDQPSR